MAFVYLTGQCTSESINLALTGSALNSNESSGYCWILLRCINRNISG